MKLLHWLPVPLGGPEAEAVQARRLGIALEAIENEPRVLGAFLWKWFPHPYPVGRDFQIASPVPRQIITWIRKDRLRSQGVLDGPEED